MTNNFRIGSVVTGTSFIGRKELVKSFKTNFLNKSRSDSVSIIGLTRIGKTSLIKNIFKKEKKGIIYSYVDLKEIHNYRQLWKEIFYPVNKYFDNNGLLTKDVLEQFEDINDEESDWTFFRQSVKDLLGYLTKNKLKLIFVLDEFDYASQIFESKTHYYELLRSIASSPDFMVSCILLSRRSLHVIEGETYQSSTFRGVFDTRYLKGFNLEDLDEYYGVFDKKNIKLTDKQKELIQYYAGNSPYLLSILGNKIIENIRLHKEVDIDKIFLEDCKQINSYYSDILKHLEIDGAKDKLVSFLLGPNIGITKADIEEMENLGYLRQIGTEDNKEYVCISQYFEQYIKYQKLHENLWESIITTEKRIKIIINNEKANILRHMNINCLYDKKEEELEILKQTPEVDQKIITTYERFILSNKKNFHIESSYFDVMALNIALKIVMNNWLIFSKYFNQTPLDNWRLKFNEIGIARNPLAHGHEEFINDSRHLAINSYCEEILNAIDNFKVVPNDTVNNCAVNYQTSFSKKVNNINNTEVKSGIIIELKKDKQGANFFVIHRQSLPIIRAFEWNNGSFIFSKYNIGDSVSFKIEVSRDGRESAILIDDN